MMRRLALSLVVFVGASTAFADEPAERLLSADTQVYFRWDGIDRHQAAFDKTAIGQILQGDTGRFFTGLMADLKDNQLLKLGKSLTAQGLVVGIEVRRVESDRPPDVQVTAVLPNSAAQWPALFATMTWAAEKSGMEVKETEVMKRTVYYLKNAPATVAFWKEGNDAVLVAALEPPAEAVQRVLAKTPRLTESALFKKVEGFKDFKPSARGFVDVTALVKRARSASMEAPRIIDGLGLDSLKDLTFFSGFDGTATRNVVIAETSGPRKGLAKLANGAPFSLDELPPLPTDLTNFTALRFDAPALFDGAVQILQNVLPEEEARQVKSMIAKANEALGIDIRNDLLGSLGSLLVTYSSPPEGPMILGQTIVLQVKDPKKLQTALEMTVQGLGKLTGVPIQLKQRTYHGVKLNSVVVSKPGFIVTPTWTVHKDWLVIGAYSQPVQGFILRAGGELPVWKPSAVVKANLDKLPSKFTLVSVDDPRPAVNTLLSLAPLAAAALQSTLPADSKLDLSALPNAHDVTRHLFPNVAVATDDGKTWRWQSIVSLSMPALGSADGMMVAMFGVTMIGQRAQGTFQPVGERIRIKE